MEYVQTVVCPDPQCQWMASVAVDPGVATMQGWRDGVIRDALTLVRCQHVVEKHVEIAQRP